MQGTELSFEGGNIPPRELEGVLIHHLLPLIGVARDDALNDAQDVHHLNAAVLMTGERVMLDDGGVLSCKMLAPGGGRSGGGVSDGW